MPRNVQHVVDAAHDPVIAVVVATGIVASEVLAGDFTPIHVFIAIIVAPNATEHAWPGLRHHQPATLVVPDGRAARVDDRGDDSGKRFGATTWLRGDRARKRAHHDPARFGLPPGIH